jgi:hypothetical protein
MDRMIIAGSRGMVRGSDRDGSPEAAFSEAVGAGSVFEAMEFRTEGVHVGKDGGGGRSMTRGEAACSTIT